MTKTLLLAIDTCTRLASVALAQEEEVQAEFTWLAGQNHTAQLAPRLQYLLSQGSLNPQSLGAVIVAIGPGSFNGV
ncbi:MAG: tRNA (adenosine(37)-N6)-threonylcarbamoyltransferase complex dimerization subunit type 1 TsaB, partial [Dehalococcoidia bacterium]|nr:tRNA (adenosine(37)-N6)-threonylcarbamoyltransferase complex dimerization subunit type 1 TsaB [Dehalococcoidia bacterium]